MTAASSPVGDPAPRPPRQRPPRDLEKLIRLVDGLLHETDVGEATAREVDHLERLDLLNGALARRGASPLLTAAEASALPPGRLAGMVTMTADRLVTVTRAMAGVV